MGNPPLLNERCYLSSFGDCSTKTSREHFISRNILERITTDKLTFEGAGHFFGGKDRIEIGIDGFVAKVLCDVHNPALSGLDAAVGVAFSNMDALGKDILRTANPNACLRSFYLEPVINFEGRRE
jgi:hypothetical protein